jgi:NAD(P)-dependent dehydrogenase (short-subunit alcohol dehydrogenase family)
MKRFQDRVAVITGAASGFGREFAFSGARRGMKLVLADVQEDALRAVTNELEARGATAVAVTCDVRHGAEVEALAGTAMSRFGSVHLLFNNAGVGSGGLLWENTVADWEWVLGVNVWGVVHGLRTFIPLMLERAKAEAEYEGHVVNTASMSGLLNPPTMGVYSASKHAVVSLSETLSHDLQLIDAPIAASVLCPYFVPTGISQSHRNRPNDVKMSARPTASQRAAQVMSEKAVSSGKVSADTVAEWTFDAVAEGKFYIYSHPGALAGVRVRMEDILESRNPSDPYASAPHIRQMLRAQIKGT